MNDPQELIDSYLDGELTTEQEKRLADWLTADREHMRRFVREAHLQRQLRDILLAQSFQVKTRPLVAKLEPPAALSLITAAVLAFRRVWLPFAVCLVLAITGFGIWYFNPTVGQPALTEIQGSGLILERAGHRLRATVGIHLEPGDLLRTPGNVTAVIGYAPEQTRITLLPGTEFKLTTLSRGKLFDLGMGKLEASVARQSPFHPMILSTPQSKARVVGTKFTLTVTTNATRLDVTEGKVRFTRLSDEQFVLVTAGHYAVAASDYELAALPATGKILREWWTMSGSFDSHSFIGLMSNPKFPDHPDGWDYLVHFETPRNWGTNYGASVCGYLLPPTTGDYTFWIAAGHYGELFLSPDDTPQNRRWIAHAYNALPHDWDESRNQQSASITLQAGRKYYIEARQMQGTDEDDYLAVAWQGPGRQREVIPGEFLAPLQPPKER